MIYYYTGHNALHPIASGPDDENAPARCRELEEQRNDGWAVLASREGRTIASADGWSEPDEPYRDAATATGMYDGW